MFYTSFIRLSAMILALAIVVIGCKKEDPIEPTPDPTDQYTQIQTGVVDDYEVELYAMEDLFVGYNALYLRITNTSTSKIADDLTVTLLPMMDMGAMQHTAPTEQPGNASADGLYEGQVVFIMPSGGMGSWTLTITLDDGSGLKELPMDITVVEKSDPRMLTFLGEDAAQEKLFVSLVEPAKWEVGVNTYEVTVHRRETMMNFLAVEDLTIEIEPEMPTMGHGSPNNVHPNHTALGHYVGEVNFTMTGLWRVHLTLKRGNDIVKEDIYFDITL